LSGPPADDFGPKRPSASLPGGTSSVGSISGPNHPIKRCLRVAAPKHDFLRPEPVATVSPDQRITGRDFEVPAQTRAAWIAAATEGAQKKVPAPGRKRRSAKKVRKAVAIKTFNPWQDPRPGYLEIDFVVHGGGSKHSPRIVNLKRSRSRDLALITRTIKPVATYLAWENSQGFRGRGRGFSLRRAISFVSGPEGEAHYEQGMSQNT
jgi:hypothetical protein